MKRYHFFLVLLYQVQTKSVFLGGAAEIYKQPASTLTDFFNISNPVSDIFSWLQF